MAVGDLKPCAYPGCDVIYACTNNRQRFHDRRESWRLSNRKWGAANKEKKAAINAAYYATTEGYMARRRYELKQSRAHAEARLAALATEEAECRSKLERLTQTRSSAPAPSTSPSCGPSGD